MSPRVRVGREYILHVAEKLFTEYGYTSVSIREIARECGVTNAAIYYHFPDKESLFIEVMHRHAENLQKAMKEAGEKITQPKERIIAVLEAYLNAIAGQRAPIFTLHKDTRHLKEPKQYRNYLMHTITQPLTEAFAFARKECRIKSTPSAEEAAALLIGMLHGLAQQHRFAGRDKNCVSKEDLKMLIDLFWDGIALPKQRGVN